MRVLKFYTHHTIPYENFTKIFHSLITHSSFITQSWPWQVYDAEIRNTGEEWHGI